MSFEAPQSTERLTIVQLADGQYNPREGVANYVNQVSTYMESQGHDVTKVVGGVVSPEEDVAIMGRTFVLPSNGNSVEMSLPISGKRARQLASELRPDIFHVQIPNIPWASGRILQNRGETAAVATFHVSPGTEMARVALKAWAQVYMHQKPADVVISNSPTTQELVGNLLGAESPVIPCPVDVQKMQEGEPLREYQDGMINTVFLGRLVERKGVKFLIDAFARVPKSVRENMRLLIAGTGELRETIQAQIEAIGLSNVEMLGFVDDQKKADLFATADIAVFPSTGGESFGIVLAEAMAARAGVVLGGDNLGYRYVLEDTPETLIDPLDANDFADRLSMLATNSLLRAELHERQQKAVKKFDIAIVGPQIEAVYQQAF